MKYTVLIIITLYFSCSKVSENKLPNLLLGKKSLNQEVKQKKIAEGLIFYSIKRGVISKKDFYTLSSGVISNKSEKKITSKLKTLGFPFRIETTAELGPHNEFLGNLIRVGNYKTIEKAKIDEAILNHNGINLAIRHTAEDGKPSNGPFLISILEMNLNEFKGQLFSELGKSEVKGKEYISSMSKRHNALAAINAGFFAWNDNVGINGEPAGISIINGELLSEATNGRSALVIENNSPLKVYIAHNLKNLMKISSNDFNYNINGINRKPGKILNCGNQLLVKSTPPVHDFVCSNPNEIIIFNRGFGEDSPKGIGFEFIIDVEGKVISKNNKRGDKIPEKGYLIQATGTFAEQLEKFIHINSKVSLKIKIMSDEGEIKLKKGIYAINGGPTLIKNSEIDYKARYEEGFETQFKDIKISDKYVDKKDKATINEDSHNNRFGFYNGWVVRRHPRTAIGITKDNKVYLVVVYGRQPKITAGASITEIAKLMKSLNCIDAFNLDGGGSSMMIVNGKKTGKSSDEDGERKVGDALLIVK